MSYALYFFAALETVGVLLVVSKVGKPRKPITGADAAITVAIAAVLVVTLVLAAGRLA